jgi:hypothetical protein
MIMSKRSKYWKAISSPLLCLLIQFTFSCGSEERYVGSYKAEADGSPQCLQIFIELKEDGEGTQRVRGDETSFRWKVKGDEIRFHTKSGGVIIGKIEDDVLKVMLPGSRIISLRKRK